MKWTFNKIQKMVLAMKGAVEEYPFGPEAAVFKVMGKMFALVAWNEKPLRVTLKSDPDEAQALRSLFEAVEPGYHMNKEHWNTVTLDGSMKDGIIEEMVVASYDLVVKKLRKAEREKLLRGGPGPKG